MAGSNRTNARSLAIAALAAGATREEAAKQAGVSEGTVYRWLRQSDFTAAVDEAQAEVVARVMAELADVSTLAVKRLRQLLDAKSETVRLGAVRTALEFSAKLRESIEIERRLVELEAAQAERGQGNKWAG